ncbi:MAG: N-acetylmuramoyl-L-alanine amidase [Rhodospirillaceae bacterium]|nr:N-acetylmuramoyl-L-alanine amidase [Rhodospirillales bacterium]
MAIDIGHTRTQPGATSARGAAEWGFNAALAQRVQAALQATGVAQVVINGAGDPIGLKDRPAAAERGGASLLVSLHHDSAQPQYLTPWTWEGKPRLFSERFSGFGLFVSGKNAEPEESTRVAIAVGDKLLAEGLRPSLHHAELIPGEGRPVLDAERGIYQYDDLVVLKYASMPAVLVEAGVIINRQDETVIATDAYRDRIAHAIAAAAAEHCRRVEMGLSIR